MGVVEAKANVLNSDDDHECATVAPDSPDPRPRGIAGVVATR